MSITTQLLRVVCILVTTGLPAADAYPSEIVQGASASLQITVRSADDKASPHARIEISENRDGSKPFEMRETSASVFHGNPSPGLYRIRIAAHGWRDATLHTIRVAPLENLELVVTLYPESWYGSHRGSVISGRVLNSTDDPIGDEDFRFSLKDSLLVTDAYIRLSSDCYVDLIGGGYFRIWLPYSNHCYVETKAPGFAIKELGGFKLKDGDTIDLGDIALSQREGIISGQIVSGADRKPLEGASVMAEGGHVKGYVLAADTGRDGRFTLYNLPPGVYSLSIRDRFKNPEYEHRELSKIAVSPGETTKIPPLELKKRQRK
jgi:hypothetical protein